jgi:hypothetical protein
MLSLPEENSNRREKKGTIGKRRRFSALWYG